MVAAQVARKLLLFEAYSNVALFGPLLMAFPAQTLQAFFPPGAATVDPLACEVWRWFGALTIAFSYVLGRAIALPNSPTEEIVLKGFLLGDVLYVGSTALWSARTTNFEMSVIGNIVYGVLLFIGRLVILSSHQPQTKAKGS